MINNSSLIVGSKLTEFELVYFVVAIQLFSQVLPGFVST